MDLIFHPFVLSLLAVIYCRRNLERTESEFLFKPRLKIVINDSLIFFFLKVSTVRRKDIFYFLFPLSCILMLRGCSKVY
jgi:hypothetical protein